MTSSLAKTTLECENMSQVFLRAEYDSEPVEIMAGWAPIESQVFVKVAALDSEGEWRDDVPLGLDAWKDVPVRPTEIAAAVALVEPIRAKLAPLGLDIPDMMLGEIATHIVLNLGNVIVRYTCDGQRELVQGGVPGYDN
jgi:hypothetical protein